MTWTAYRGPIVESDTGASYTIAYSDGAKKFQTEYQTAQVTDDLIKQTARSEIARLNTVVAGKGKVTIGQGEVIDTSVSAKPANPEKDAFFSNVSLLDELLRWSSRGLIQPEDSRIIELRSVLIATWSDEYL